MLRLRKEEYTPRTPEEKLVDRTVGVCQMLVTNEYLAVFYARQRVRTEVIRWSSAAEGQIFRNFHDEIEIPILMERLYTKAPLKTQKTA